jgi:replicative DNA helicase
VIREEALMTTARQTSKGPAGTKIPELLSEAGLLPGFIAGLIAIQGKRDFLGLDTGWTHLNRVINGLMPGLFIVGGGPGSGKTTFVLQLAWQVAELNQVPVLFYSLDQAVDDLRIRTVSRVINIENRDLFRGCLDPKGPEVKKLDALASSLRGEVLF